MNLIAFVGNTGQIPVLRYTGSGTPVANVTLATNRVYRDRDGNRQQTTEWHRLVVWGEGAKTFAEIVGKGDLLSVRGRLEYKTREIAGEKVQDASVRVLEWNKLSPRKAQPEGAAAAIEDAGEETGQDVTLETEIEVPSFGTDDLEAAGSGTIEPAGAEPSEPAARDEALPGETATEQDIPFPKTRGRKK